MTCCNTQAESCTCDFQKKVLKKLKKIQCKLDQLNPTNSVTYTLGEPGNPPAGTIVSIPSLIGKTLIVVFIAGVADNRYTFNINTGDFDFTLRGGTSLGTELTIIYK